MAEYLLLLLSNASLDLIFSIHPNGQLDYPYRHPQNIITGSTGTKPRIMSGMLGLTYP